MLQMQPRKHVLDHADCPTRQRELDHINHTDHTDQRNISRPEVSTVGHGSGNRRFVARGSRCDLRREKSDETKYDD